MSAEAVSDALARATKARAERAATEPERFRDPEPADWWDVALENLRDLARRPGTFTVGDLVGRISELPADRRVIGNVLLEARRRGWIAPAGWESGGRTRHGRPIRKWRGANAGPGP